MDLSLGQLCVLLAERGVHLNAVGAERAVSSCALRDLTNEEAVYLVRASALDLEWCSQNCAGVLVKELKTLPENKRVPINSVLQVLSVEDVSHPTSRQDSDNKRRLLKICLTDGISKCTAVEYRRLSMLSLRTPPGSKLLVKEPMMRAGMLWLEEADVEVEKGTVPALYEAWQQRTQAQARVGQTVSHAPQFAEFGARPPAGKPLAAATPGWQPSAAAKTFTPGAAPTTPLGVSHGRRVEAIPAGEEEASHLAGIEAEALEAAEGGREAFIQPCTSAPMVEPLAVLAPPPGLAPVGPGGGVVVKRVGRGRKGERGSTPRIPQPLLAVAAPSTQAGPSSRFGGGATRGNPFSNPTSQPAESAAPALAPALDSSTGCTAVVPRSSRRKKEKESRVDAALAKMKEKAQEAHNPKPEARPAAQRGPVASSSPGVVDYDYDDDEWTGTYTVDEYKGGGKGNSREAHGGERESGDAALARRLQAEMELLDRGSGGGVKWYGGSSYNKVDQEREDADYAMKLQAEGTQGGEAGSRGGRGKKGKQKKPRGGDVGGAMGVDLVESLFAFPEVPDQDEGGKGGKGGDKGGKGGKAGKGDRGGKGDRCKGDSGESGKGGGKGRASGEACSFYEPGVGTEARETAQVPTAPTSGGHVHQPWCNGECSGRCAP